MKWKKKNKELKEKDNDKVKENNNNNNENKSEKDELNKKISILIEENNNLMNEINKLKQINEQNKNKDIMNIPKINLYTPVLFPIEIKYKKNLCQEKPKEILKTI